MSEEVSWGRRRPETWGHYWMKEEGGAKKLVTVGGPRRQQSVTIDGRCYHLSGAAFDECSWYGPLQAPPG